MKKFTKILGVTLLEIMLVLAIAAMVIVMSVRYYQTASAGQQANAMMQMIQGISSAADGLAQGTGSYSEAGVSSATIADLMPNRKLISPWGTTVTIGSVTGSTYEVTFPETPGVVCAQVKARMQGNDKYSGVSGLTCTAGTAMSFTYTYDATK